MVTEYKTALNEIKRRTCFTVLTIPLIYLKEFKHVMKGFVMIAQVDTVGLAVWGITCKGHG